MSLLVHTSFYKSMKKPLGAGDKDRGSASRVIASLASNPGSGWFRRLDRMGPMLQEARLLATPSRTEGTSLSEGDLIRGREILGDFLGDFAGRCPFGAPL